MDAKYLVVRCSLCYEVAEDANMSIKRCYGKKIQHGKKTDSDLWKRVAKRSK
jgi:hypothetical protein